MLKIKDYGFEISITDIPYLGKDLTSAVLVNLSDPDISTEEKESALEIKKKYHVKATKKLKLCTKRATIENLALWAVNGYGFSSVYDFPSIKWDTKKNRYIPTTSKKVVLGEEVKTFPSYYKKKDYFNSSNVIAIDIDECSCTPREFIERLSRKPNFWYTSYSNRVIKDEGQNGYRFRLVYVFFLPIDDYYYYRFCAQMIIDRISRECQDLLPIPIDDCSCRASQIFWGNDCNNTYGEIIDFDCDLIYPDDLYVIRDFPEINVCNYINYLREGRNGCRYKSPDELRRLVFLDRADKLESMLRSGETVEDSLNRAHEINEDNGETRLTGYVLAYELGLSQQLATDFIESKNQSDWYYRYSSKYPVPTLNKRYISSPNWLIEDGLEYMPIPDDYFKQWNYMIRTKTDKITPEGKTVYEWKPYIFKNHRRKALYGYLIETRLLNPWLTYDKLMTLAIDFYYNHLDLGRTLRKKVVVNKVNEVYKIPVDELTLAFENYIEAFHDNYMKNHPNQKYIFKIDGNIGKTHKILADIKEKKNLEIMNPWLTAKENQKILEDNGIKLSISEINEQLKPIRDSLTKEWQSKVDITKSPKQNYAILSTIYPELTLTKLENYIKHSRRNL